LTDDYEVNYISTFFFAIYMLIYIYHCYRLSTDLGIILK